MWFRNLQIFRLLPEWTYSTDALNEALHRGRFQPCGKADRRSTGWIPPRGEEGVMVFAIGSQQLIALGIEEKILPASVVRQHAAAKAEAIAEAQGYKPGRKQMREIMEQIETDLLAKALTKRGLVYIWIDLKNRWLIIDTSSSARADEVIEALKQSLGELPLALLKTNIAPSSAMTQWLAAGEAPEGFSIDRDGELQAHADGRPTVRYTRHDIDNDEVRNHIANGKTVTRLALTWNDRVSFVLTEKQEIKRLAFLDILKEDAERQSENADDLFAANFSLMAGELAQVMGALVKVLGDES